MTSRSQLYFKTKKALRLAIACRSFLASKGVYPIPCTGSDGSNYELFIIDDRGNVIGTSLEERIYPSQQLGDGPPSGAVERKGVYEWQFKI